MRKTKRLVLSVERLRNLTPSQLGRAVGGEPINIEESVNVLCNTFDVDCDNTLTDTNLTTIGLTNNTLTNTLMNTEF